jgi:hypothetical protein
VEIVRIDLTHQPILFEFVRISAKILQRFMDVKLVPTNGCASIFALAIGEVEANGDVGEVHTRELSYFSRLSQASEFNRQSPVEVFRRTTTESRRQRRVLKSLKQLQAGETLSAPVSTCRVQLQNSEDAAQKKPAKVRAKSLYKPAAAILVGEKYSAALGTALQKVYPRENVTRTTAMTSTATTFTRGAPDIPEHGIIGDENHSSTRRRTPVPVNDRCTG